MKWKRLWVRLLMLLLPAVLALGAGAEGLPRDTIYIERTGQQMAYGRWVAQLNRYAEGGSLGEIQAAGLAEPLTAVLVRTDGSRADFSPWRPRYVVAGPCSCFTLYFEGETAARQAIAELSVLPGIRYAEQDGEVSAASAPAYSFQSWGAERMQLAPFLEYAESWGSGSVTVAVLDSGVSSHPQLAGRLIYGGYDYVDGDYDITNDMNGHGTNVAGILADCTMETPVYLYPIRVLNAGGGGRISNVVNAIREAVQQGAKVINLSLTSRSLSQAMDEAILDAVNAGVTVVAAAGNQGVDTAGICPAHMTNSGVIVVGSAESGGSRAIYSNYGASVDIYAYGTGIRCCSTTGGYTTNTGTSMAAPHISALAALLQLLHPGLGPAETESRICLAAQAGAAVPVPELTRLVPERLGFSLTRLEMGRNQTIPMPTAATPATAREAIRYTSSDEAVVQIIDGCLVPVDVGTAEVTAQCLGLGDSRFTVEVSAEGSILTIPAGVKAVEDEAFRGAEAITGVIVPEGVEQLGSLVLEDCGSLRLVSLPGSLKTLGENTFSSSVVLCPPGSPAEQYALKNGLDYIAGQ